MPIFEYNQLTYTLIVIIIWYGRILYLNRIIHTSDKTRWRSYYYLVLSIIIILFLPNVCLFFIFGFPLPLLIRHVYICRVSNISIINGSSSESYSTALQSHNQARPKIGTLIVGNFRVLFALLVFVELGFALNGYYPGRLEKSAYFQPVNHLITLQGYTADEMGIMKVSKRAQQYVGNFISNGEQTSRISTEFDLFKRDFHVTPHIICRDYLQLQDPNFANNFTRFIEKIKEQTTKSLLEAEYLHYSKSPINDEGFRSISFENHQTSRTKVS